MSGHGHGGGGLTGPIMGVIFVIAVLFVLWYYTGGPERAQNAQPFMKAPAPVDTGETYGPTAPIN